MSKKKAISIIEEEERKTEKSKEHAKNVFEQLKSQYNGDKKALRELKDSINKKLVYSSNVVEVMWSCEGGKLLDTFQLVDTPGLNQELLDGELRPAFDEYYNKADGVLWLLDANKIEAQYGFEVLDEHGYVTNKNVIGVLNKIDMIGGIGSQKAEESVNKAKKIYKGKFSAIVPLSALQALNGVINKDNDLVEKSGYTRLMKEINDLFLKNGLKIRYERKLEGLKEYTGKIKKHVDQYLNRLSQDEVKYDDLKSSFYKELNS